MTDVYIADTRAAADPRVQLLAELLGQSRAEAFGRVMMLWLHCASVGTNRPGAVAIRACLGTQGEQALIEAELGTRLDGEVAVRDTSGREIWYRSTSKPATARANGGRARVAGARRDQHGRLLGNAGMAMVQQSPASNNAGCVAGPATSSIPAIDPHSGSLSPDLPLQSPEPPDPQTIAEAESPTLAPVLRLAAVPARSRDDRRRKLWMDAWTYAGLKHQELKAAGVDPDARNCWSALPDASSPEARALFERIDQLLLGDEPDFAAASELIKNRVDVAAEEAKLQRHLRFMTPMRMWAPESFAIAAALSPMQVRAQAAAPARAGPRRAPPDEPVRRVKTFD